MLDRLMWFVVNICKTSSFIKMKTLQCLKKIYFLKKYNNIIKGDTLKIYIQ
jgi:hypothetical protein